MKGRKLKLITEILAIIVICLISFVGVYKQKANKMENQVKGYEFNKDLKGYRELVFEVSDATEVKDSNGKVVGSTDEYSDSTIESNSLQKTDTKINSEEELKFENYEKAKSIIETRLKDLQVTDYNIGLDKETGKIYLQIPEDSTTDHTISNILQVGNFSIKDSKDNSKVFITNEDIKNVAAVYNTTSSGTTVYLQFEFNKNGKNKLKELSSGEYAKKEENENTTTEGETTNQVEANATTENTSSNENSENEDKEENANSEGQEDSQKEIILAIDQNDMITTSFETPIEDGIIDLSMNKETTDNDSISETLQSASTIALLLNSGKMPLTYKVSSNSYMNSDISEETLQKVICGVAIMVAVALIVLIIKYKGRGLIAAISSIGFIALYLLVVRYTNVSVSIESIVSAVIVLALNYLFVSRLANIKESDEELRDMAYINEFKSYILKMLPVFFIAVIFSFIQWAKIATFGMFLFWGILLSVVYHYLVTRDMLD